MTPTAIPMTLHAELLPNIRQIALYISIPARLGIPKSNGDSTRVSVSHSPEPEVSVSLSESRRAITVTLTVRRPLEHDGQSNEEVSETLKLPGMVGEMARDALRNLTKQRAQLVRNSGGNGTNDTSGEDDGREYSFRMPLDLTGNGNSTMESDLGDFVPWTAGDMSPYTRLRCRHCLNEVLSEPSTTTGWVWKDLPSGNWAEMMDFWHCHKPDSHDDDAAKTASSAVDDSTHAGKVVDEKNANVKGYGAANRVVAVRGTVLVDVVSFLVTEGDCRGLRKEQPIPTSSGPSIICAKCNRPIGTEDVLADGWKLFKANLSVSTPAAIKEGPGTQEPLAWESHSVEILVSAQILEMVERESAKRFVMHSDGKKGLLLWIFNPDLRYSNTNLNETHTYTHAVASQRAMKVFYQDVSDVDGLLNPGGPDESGTRAATSFSLEELELPGSIYEEILHVLARSNEMLPVSARRFREWKVGLLSRFEKTRVGS